MTRGVTRGGDHEMHIDYMNLAAIIHALDMCHITVVSRVVYTLNTIALEADTAQNQNENSTFYGLANGYKPGLRPLHIHFA